MEHVREVRLPAEDTGAALQPITRTPRAGIPGQTPREGSRPQWGPRSLRMDVEEPARGTSRPPGPALRRLCPEGRGLSPAHPGPGMQWGPGMNEQMSEWANDCRRDTCQVPGWSLTLSPHDAPDQCNPSGLAHSP